MNPPTHLPDNLRPLLWDCDLAQLDLRQHATFVIERLMVYTTPAAYRWLLEAWPREQLLEVALHSRRLGGRDRAFWTAILTAP
jgi:hypothetical protein